MPSFQISLNKRLRNLGLEGDLAWVIVHEGALQLQDNTQHVVRIAPTEIFKVRIGFVDARRRLYHTRVWRDLREKPLELVPTSQTWTGYRDTVYALVQLMIVNNQRDRIETGASKFDALFGPTLMLIPTIGALILALFVLTDEPWWGRIVIPIIPTTIFAMLVWIGAKRYWPTSIRDVEDLKRQLPSS